MGTLLLRPARPAWWTVGLGALAALALTVGGCSCSDDPGDGDGGPDAAAPDAGDLDGDVTGGCGDGVRDRMTELCDDGNTVDGDGCSADCLSDESCGNGIVDRAVGEICDDENTDDGDGCRGDCLSDYACGNGVVDTTASGGSVDEACDDGNTMNGDGCSAGCDSDESCGNSIVDLGAGEVCDDGNTVDGDDCSADCMTSLLCGNGTIDGSEECDDGNTTDGDGCNASCQMERCGNGRVDGGEDCDDGNTDDTDGCTATCAFTCSADADCDDGAVCTGTETCSDPGTTSSACVAGTPLGEGDPCGGGNVCRAGSCVAPGCGDGVVSGTEDCDDMNTTDGDGCESDCSWTCAGDSDCADTNTCNGAETCTSPSSLASRCNAGTAPATGTLCDRDGMAATRDICMMSTMTCVASVCGDGYTDAGATPAEQCDDGNTTSGDGCSSTCTMETATPPTAFRVRTARLISPRITVSVPFGGCQDITDNCASVFGSCQADSVNTLLQTALRPTSMGGDFDLHIVELFRPLNPASPTSPTEAHFNAMCTEGTPHTCGPDPAPDMLSATATNLSTGTCYMPMPAEVNTRAGSPATYGPPTANTVGGPCYSATVPTLTIVVGGISVPLTNATVAATYSGGTPPTTLVSGIITGFLSEADAVAATLPSDLPLVGGDPLYEHLQAGNRSYMGTPDGCNVGGGTHEDDADMDGAVRGFRFFINFEAELVTWTGP